MPSTFDLPRRDKVQLGDTLYQALYQSKMYDLAPVYTQDMAVQAYLMGDRAFEIEDPYRPGTVLLIVDVPRDQPAWETLVSDVSQEIGRQLRMDPMPNTKRKDLSLSAQRDAAVGLGMLRYLFPTWVVEPAHRAFQEMRVTGGCAGLAVSETYYPGQGWGLHLQAIPAYELSFLPVRAQKRSLTQGVTWRRWITLRHLEAVCESLSRKYGRKISLPVEGSDEYKRMNVRHVQSGISCRDMIRARGLGLVDPMSSDLGEQTSSYEKTGEQKQRRTRVVEYSQSYLGPNQRHSERDIHMVGRHILVDKEYAQEKMPLIPIGVGCYADVGGPYGRSYAYPKMMAALYGERVLVSMAKNASEIDAYGMILASTSMGVDLEEAQRFGNGARYMQYTADPGAPTHQPIQFAPTPLGRVYGGLAQVLMGLGNTVFPQSPIYSGQATGRFDSDVALQRLDILGNTQIAAGALSAAQAYAQVYAAGLEMSNKHYKEGDKIPLVFVGEEMAGVVLDTETIPKSEDEIQQDKLVMVQENNTLEQQGIVPIFARALQEAGVRDFGLKTGSEGAVPGAGTVQRIPVGRFTIGPNTIPHPDAIEIAVQSIMPRDKDAEVGQLLNAMKLGGMSLMEVQIELFRRGLDVPMGGRDVINAYKSSVMNILSAYGNGIEAGPVIFSASSPLWRVGKWALGVFMESPEFLSASETVKSQIRQLADIYNPVNTQPTMLTADEAAQQQAMMQQQQVRAQTPQSMRNAGPAPGLPNFRMAG